MLTLAASFESMRCSERLVSVVHSHLDISFRAKRSFPLPHLIVPIGQLDEEHLRLKLSGQPIPDENPWVVRLIGHGESHSKMQYRHIMRWLHYLEVLSR